MQLLCRVLPSDNWAGNTVDRSASAVDVFDEPRGARDVPLTRQLLLALDDHPMITSYLGGGLQLILRPRRIISDLISQHDFHRTRVYGDLFRPMRLEHQRTAKGDKERRGPLTSSAEEAESTAGTNTGVSRFGLCAIASVKPPTSPPRGDEPHQPAMQLGRCCTSPNRACGFIGAGSATGA